MSVTTDWRQAAELAHFGFSRPALADDAVDGAQPALVIEPTEPTHVAATLAWVTRERLMTVIRGRGTKIGWGRRPSRVDVVLSTVRLNQQIVHRHGDLTATVPAGVRLVDLNRQLAGQGQWLPLDTPFEGATIGGLVATNDSGPLRHRYGTPRDLLIGMTLALTDGTVVKSGGHVVKNVAGYDLAKLVSGSFGTLGVIVDATFKLLPVPPVSQTLVVAYSDPAALARDAAAMAGSQLEPVALDVRLQVGAGASVVRELALRFATSPAATSAQVSDARRLLAGDVHLLTGADEEAWWSEQVRQSWTLGGTTLRVSWMPATLPQVLGTIEELVQASGGAAALTGRAAIGAGLLRLDADDRVVTAAIERLRAKESPVTNVIVLRRRGTLDGVDTWGAEGSAAHVMRSLKQTFDPAGILNAGRGPI